MMRDIVRTACVIVGMAAAASLFVEVRFQAAALTLAQRQGVTPSPYPQPAPPGRLRAFGRSILDMADAGLGVVR